MSKKTNIILIILTILFFIAFVLSIYFKFKTKNNIDYKNKIIKVGEKKELVHDIIYFNKFNDKVIKENTQLIEYSLFKQDNVLYGNILIGNDNKLYITDDINDKKYLIFDLDVKTITTNEKNIRSNFSFYAITLSGDLYKISILGTNISSKSNIMIKKLNLPEKITNFVDVSINSLVDDLYRGAVVIGESGKLYHADTLTEYDESTINVFDTYIIYGDKTITNFNKNILKDSSNNNYLVKTVIIANEILTYFEENLAILIVTTDNSLIYLNGDGNLVEYYKKVKDITTKDFDARLVFDDNSYIDFLYFCINDI